MISKLDHFNYDLLPALDTLLAERNVTRAAEKLCVSQPAMSGALQRLRDHFNDPLLVRAGRDMELTPLGKVLVDPVRDLLVRTRALLALGPDFRPEDSRRVFNLAMSDYPATMLLPRVARRVAAGAPGVRLNIQPLQSTSYEQLQAGGLDMVITAREPMLARERFASCFENVALFNDRFVCVVDKANPFVGERLTLENYKSLAHVQVDFGLGMTTLEDDVRRELSLRVSVAVTTNGFVNLLSLLVGTDLVGAVQERLARRFEPILPIRILDPPLPIPDLTESLIWHKRGWADHGHGWLRGLFQEEAAYLAGGQL